MKCLLDGSTKFIVFNQDNRYALFDTAGFALTKVVAGPNYLYSPAGTTGNYPLSAFHVSTTNYVLLGTSPIGVGVNRLDFVANSATVGLGGCDAKQYIGYIFPLNNNVMAVGPTLALRSISTGVELAVYSVTTNIYTILSPILGTLRFVAFDSKNKRVEIISAATSPNSLALQSTITSFNGKAIKSIGYLQTLAVSVVCEGGFCYAINLSTLAAVWSHKYSAISLGEPRVVPIKDGKMFFLVGYKGDRQVSLMVNATSSVAPAEQMRDTCATEIKTSDIFANGRFLIIQNINGLRLLVNQSELCDTTCYTCNGPGLNNCTSCYPGFSLMPAGVGSCSRIVCDSTCASCFGSAPTQCLSCDTTVRLLDTATSSCVLIPPVQVIPPPSPMIEGCFVRNEAYNSINDNCYICNSTASFNANRSGCTTGDAVRYFDWNVSLQLSDNGVVSLRYNIRIPKMPSAELCTQYSQLIGSYPL